MTTHITTHASSHCLNRNVNATTNQCSTRTSVEDHDRIPETSSHRRNDHQGIWCKVEEATAPSPIISSPTDSSPTDAKASHLANDSRHRVPSKETALYVARLATVLLIVHSVANSKLCLCSHNNPLRLTTLSRETECWATHYWLQCL